MAEKITTIHITRALSSSMIMELMNEYPHLKEITCAPSVYNRTSKKYISALSHLEIEVNQKYNWGAESRTDGQEFEVQDLAAEGLTPKEISQKLGITLNRVYYLLKKTNSKFDNRKRKYNHDEVKAIKDEGLSPKEISQKLDMPLRSVYYILNKK